MERQLSLAASPGRLGAMLSAAALAMFLGAACYDTPPREEVRRVSDGVAEVGALAIRARGCGSCHVIAGIPEARGLVGPSLDGFGRRPFVAGVVGNSVDSLVRWIEDPPSIKPGTTMPDLGIPASEARHIAAYLYTLR